MTKKIERLRDALNDDELETMQEAVRIALDEKQKAMNASNELGMRLAPKDFGIPALRIMQVRLNAAYELEERAA